MRVAGVVELVSRGVYRVASLDPLANSLDAATVRQLLDELGQICRARLITGCAAISLVGRQMRANLHRLAPVLEVFDERRVHLVCQAANDLNFTFSALVKGSIKADLGSGAGFPGLIVAALHNGPVTLVEERRLRVDFLHRAAEIIGVAVEIVGARIERVAPRPFDVISARAFAPLGRLLALATGFSTRKTIWLLPKGRNAESELEALEPSWQGDFRLEPSLTDPDARIIVAEGISRRGAGSRV